MCGIVGYVGGRQAYPILIKGLTRLEYRGYDSAGVALVGDGGELAIYKTKGKVKDLEQAAAGKDVSGSIGIAHTRWATHGEPSDVNSHPHCSENHNLALIHNGIIENYRALKTELTRKGYHFQSETDTEVVIQLIQYMMDSTGASFDEAVPMALNNVVGAYALVIMDKNQPDKLIAARKGSPLIIGVGENEFFVGSDASPIIEYTNKVVYLGEEQIAYIQRGQELRITDLSSVEQPAQVRELEMSLSEIEKGGEVALEQLWLQKSFAPQFNVRIGHIVVPVGGLNNAHEPLNFFTVFRPEGESTILPSTWHDTGLSLWGEAGKWRYEALVVAGLAFMFDRDNFIKHGAGSPYEYKVANNLGFAARVDNFSVKDLRLSLSGFYGQAMHNSYPNDMWNTRYADVEGHTLVGAFDFAYTGKYLTVRGNADWGYVSDAATISTVKRNLSSNDAPYKKTPVGRNAVAAGLEAGYDFLHLFSRGRDAEQKLYLFGRYEYYDSYIPAADQPDYPYTDRHRMAVGLNWLPIPQVALKCEYSRRFLKSQYNGEPSLSLGIVYMGFFNR